MTRAAALAASVYLVIAYADERGTWFWVGLLLVVLNLTGLVAQVRSRGRVSEPVQPASDLDADSVRLVDVLGDPAVVSAWATAPPSWVQVAYLDDPSGPLEPAPAAALAAYVWLARDGEEWQVAVGDEVKPYLDLDAPEDDDAVLRVLRSHPAVAEAWHEDREVYVVRPRHTMPLDRFARLAARALASGQVAAAGRLP